MSEFDLHIDFDFDSIIDGVDEIKKKQLPFAASLAATKTAFKVRNVLKAKVAQSFRNPTPWAKNSIFSRRSMRKPNADFSNNWSSTVWVKDGLGQGTPAIKFLGPNIYGGGRHKKRFERALIAKGVMKRSEWAMPGKGARKDRFGNMAKGQIVQILSSLQAFSRSGHGANRRDEQRARFYFAEIGGVRGVWQRVGRGRNEKRKLVLYFTKKTPRYRAKRFDFFGITDWAVDQIYPREFEQAMQRAIETRRR